jgi:UDP-glucose 4-epimerase
VTNPHFFLAGGAGFIGSHLVDRLVERGTVTVYDNLSVGKREFIAPHLESGGCRLVEGDLLDLPALESALGEAQPAVVFQLAANPEARWGLENTRLDLEQGTIATYHVLEAMRRTGACRLVFSSSGTVYGDTGRVCAEQDLGELPISLYGASKLGCEALVSSFVECFGFSAWIFRFGNVVGPRGTHGAALDFLRKLDANPAELEVLGDGRQAKPYIFVTDCVDGILFGLDHADQRLNLYNLSPPDTTSVARIAELCVEASPYPGARIRYTGGDRGWPGDVPRSRLSGEKLAELGWRPGRSSDQAVCEAVRALAREVFGGRDG